MGGAAVTISVLSLAAVHTLGIKVDMGGELQDTSVMLAIKDIERQLDSAEKQRQLYVAMTRAQDRLILSGTYDSSSKSSHNDRSEAIYQSLHHQDTKVHDRLLDAGHRRQISNLTKDLAVEL